jgi:two-component system LytT family response regulator
MIRAAIVEDEPPALAGLKLLLLQDHQIKLVAECGTVEEALHVLELRPVELLFLDVRLGRRTGFDLLEELGAARPPAVVFVTAYDEHAVRAFEVEAVDYLLKPFDDQRFQQALSRAKERLWLHRAALATQLAAGQTPARPPQPAQMLALRDGTRSTFLRLDEIDWIEAQDNYVEIHAGAETWLHRETLRELEGRLDARRFARIHRSAIVQLDRIRELRSLPGGDGSVVLRDGTELRLSRTHREALRSLLGS